MLDQVTKIDQATLFRLKPMRDDVWIELSRERSDLPHGAIIVPEKSERKKRQQERHGNVLKLGPECDEQLSIGSRVIFRLFAPEVTGNNQARFVEVDGVSVVVVRQGMVEVMV